MTDLHRHINQDVMRLCMRDEKKMYVVEEEVGIWVEREIGDMNVVVAKGSSSLDIEKAYPDTLF